MTEESAPIPIKEDDKNLFKKLDDKTFKFECDVSDKLRLGLREIDNHSPSYFESFYSKKELEEIIPIFRACNTLEEIKECFFNLFKQSTTKLQLAENQQKIFIVFKIGWISGTKEIKFELIKKTEFNTTPINNSDISQDKNINELKEELNESKKTILLNNKKKELENKLQSIDSLYLNKIQSLENIINQKDEELNKMKEKLQNNNKDNRNNSKIIKGGDKCVIFISNDENLIYGIPCSGDDLFCEIEEIFYREYPEYRGKNNIFLNNEKEILRFKTINENNIESGKPIMLIISS